MKLTKNDKEKIIEAVLEMKNLAIDYGSLCAQEKVIHYLNKNNDFTLDSRINACIELNNSYLKFQSLIGDNL